MAAKYEVARSRMHIRKVGEATLRDVNVIDSATYSFDEQKITKQSTNEVFGVVAEKTVSVTGTLTVTFGSTEFENFVLATRARESTQGAVSGETFELPALAAGQAFKLPHENITTVSIPGKTEGVDYQLFAISGLIVAINDITAAIPGCSYSAGVAKRGAIAAGSAETYEVIFTDVLNGSMTRFYKWSPSLPQNVQLVQPNEFGNYEVSGALLLDESKPADGVLGQFGVKVEA